MMQLVWATLALSVAELLPSAGGVSMRASSSASLARAGGVLARLGNASTAAASSSSSAESFTPTFYAPQLTPTQFLFASSPSEKKIVYTELKNFKSLTGRTFALVDSGLIEPAGLAFDNNGGFLYVADKGASKIYRYRVIIEKSTVSGVTNYALVTDGVQICIMQGMQTDWVSVDVSGDVFFADMGSKTINRIPGDTIDRIAEGYYSCGDLQVKSEKVIMAEAETKVETSLSETAATLQASPQKESADTEPVILQLYEGDINPQVTLPGGVVSDGSRLYWTNMVNGSVAGTVCAGRVDPQLPLVGNQSGLSPFPVISLTTTTDTAYGIAKSNTVVFYSTNTTGSGAVFGVMEDGTTMPFVSSLVEPRGLVWDGDNTIYVADQATDTVYSFPAGRMMGDAPLTTSVVLHAPFGVALLGNIEAVTMTKAGAAGLRQAGASLRWLLLPLLVAAATLLTSAPSWV